MKIRILDEAEQDLVDGVLFYEAQDRGLGDYFFDSLSADIDSLQLFGGIHPIRSGDTVCLPHDSRTPSITRS